MTDLSVVLISRNQAWNIGRLIESVLARTRDLPVREIVLVDSASTDGTVEVASSYPIDVLQLRADQRLTAALGRHVGYQHSRGELVLFLDGDMELCEGWLERALAVMEERPDLGAVSGPWLDRPKDSSPGAATGQTLPGQDREDMARIRYSAHGVDTSVKRLGGAAMYRRSVLQEVGGFDPHLYSDEEPELCLRIRSAGYGLLQLAQPIALHYTEPNEAITTLLGRRRRGLYYGTGQVMRQLLGRPIFWPYVLERGHGCIVGLALLLGLALLVLSGATGHWLWFLLFLLLAAGVLAAAALRKGSLYAMLYSLVHRLLILEGTIKGLMMRRLEPSEGEPQVQVIKISHA